MKDGCYQWGSQSASSLSLYGFLLQDNETDYKSLYEKEKADHATTTDRLSMCEAQLKEKDKKLNEIELKHKNEMDSLKKKVGWSKESNQAWLVIMIVYMTMQSDLLV